MTGTSLHSNFWQRRAIETFRASVLCAVMGFILLHQQCLRHAGCGWSFCLWAKYAMERVLWRWLVEREPAVLAASCERVLWHSDGVCELRVAHTRSAQLVQCDVLRAVLAGVQQLAHEVKCAMSVVVTALINSTTVVRATATVVEEDEEPRVMFEEAPALLALRQVCCGVVIAGLAKQTEERRQRVLRRLDAAWHLARLLLEEDDKQPSACSPFAPPSPPLEPQPLDRGHGGDCLALARSQVLKLLGGTQHWAAAARMPGSGHWQEVRSDVGVCSFAVSSRYSVPKEETTVSLTVLVAVDAKQNKLLLGSSRHMAQLVGTYRSVVKSECGRESIEEKARMDEAAFPCIIKAKSPLPALLLLFVQWDEQRAEADPNLYASFFAHILSAAGQCIRSQHDEGEERDFCARSLAASILDIISSSTNPDFVQEASALIALAASQARERQQESSQDKKSAAATAAATKNKLYQVLCSL